MIISDDLTVVEMGASGMWSSRIFERGSALARNHGTNKRASMTNGQLAAGSKVKNFKISNEQWLTSRWQQSEKCRYERPRGLRPEPKFLVTSHKFEKCWKLSNSCEKHSLPKTNFSSALASPSKRC